MKTFKTYNEELNLASYEINTINYMLPITIKFVQDNTIARKEISLLRHELEKFRRLRIRNNRMDLQKKTTFTAYSQVSFTVMCTPC